MNYKIKNQELLTHAEEKKLVTLAQAGNELARQKLIERNIKFIIKVALQYKAYSPVEDLTGEGVLGLNHAIDTFEVDRNLKFITHAVWWIKAYITQYLKEKKSLIRIPANKREEIRAAIKDNNITPEIQHFMNLNSRGVQLDKPISSSEGNATFQDLLEEPDKSRTPGSVNEYSVMEFVGNILKRLSDTERKILTGLFGLEGNKKMTLKEIGANLKLSHERVRQLKQQAIRKIQKSDDSNILLDKYLQAFGEN